MRWLGADLDSADNVRILRVGEGAAADGPAGLAGRVEAALTEVRAAVPAEPAGRTVKMLQYPSHPADLRRPGGPGQGTGVGWGANWVW